jgi:hypothetical protein
MNTSIEQMEFKIFDSLFCSNFRIQKGAFAFDEYVAKVFQRFVHHLIEIRLRDWLYVTIVLFGNLARVKLNLHLLHCNRDDVACVERDDLYIFTIAGM